MRLSVVGLSPTSSDAARVMMCTVGMRRLAPRREQTWLSVIPSRRGGSTSAGVWVGAGREGVGACTDRYKAYREHTYTVIESSKKKSKMSKANPPLAPPLRSYARSGRSLNLPTYPRLCHPPSHLQSASHLPFASGWLTNGRASGRAGRLDADGYVCATD